MHEFNKIKSYGQLTHISSVKFHYRMSQMNARNILLLMIENLIEILDKDITLFLIIKADSYEKLFQMLTHHTRSTSSRHKTVYKSRIVRKCWKPGSII